MLRYIARAFLLDSEDRVLLIKHKNNQPRVLPGGHVEEGESLTGALRRELTEELNLTGVDILGMKNRTNQEGVIMKPTPICIHETQYEREGKMTHRLEFWYFVRTDQTDIAANEEVAEHQRFGISEVLALSAPDEIFLCMKDVLEQNEELLELL